MGLNSSEIRKDLFNPFPLRSSAYVEGWRSITQQLRKGEPPFPFSENDVIEEPDPDDLRGVSHPLSEVPILWTWRRVSCGMCVKEDEPRSLPKQADPQNHPRFDRGSRLGPAKDLGFVNQSVSGVEVEGSHDLLARTFVPPPQVLGQHPRIPQWRAIRDPRTSLSDRDLGGYEERSQGRVFVAGIESGQEVRSMDLAQPTKFAQQVLGDLVRAPEEDGDEFGVGECLWAPAAEAFKGGFGWMWSRLLGVRHRVIPLCRIGLVDALPRIGRAILFEAVSRLELRSTGSRHSESTPIF